MSKRFQGGQGGAERYGSYDRGNEPRPEAPEDRAQRATAVQLANRKIAAAKGSHKGRSQSPLVTSTSIFEQATQSGLLGPAPPSKPSNPFANKPAFGFGHATSNEAHGSGTSPFGVGGGSFGFGGNNNSQSQQPAPTGPFSFTFGSNTNTSTNSMPVFGQPPPQQSQQQQQQGNGFTPSSSFGFGQQQPQQNGNGSNGMTGTPQGDQTPKPAASNLFAGAFGNSQQQNQTPKPSGGLFSAPQSQQTPQPPANNPFGGFASNASSQKSHSFFNFGQSAGEKKPSDSPAPQAAVSNSPFGGFGQTPQLTGEKPANQLQSQKPSADAWATFANLPKNTGAANPPATNGFNPSTSMFGQPTQTNVDNAGHVGSPAASVFSSLGAPQSKTPSFSFTPQPQEPSHDVDENMMSPDNTPHKRAGLTNGTSFGAAKHDQAPGGPSDIEDTTITSPDSKTPTAMGKGASLFDRISRAPPPQMNVPKTPAPNNPFASFSKQPPASAPPKSLFQPANTLFGAAPSTSAAPASTAPKPSPAVAPPASPFQPASSLGAAAQAPTSFTAPKQPVEAASETSTQATIPGHYESMRELNESLLHHLKTQDQGKDWGSIFQYYMQAAAKLQGKPLPQSEASAAANGSNAVTSSSSASMAPSSTNLQAAAQTPAAQTPAAQMPPPQMPAVQASAAQPPIAQAPAAHPPAAQTPFGQAPAAQVPLAHPPATQAPLNQAPAAQVPLNQAPAAQVPLNQAPAAQVPLNQAPAAQVPFAQVPAAQTSFGQAPAAQVPLVQPLAAQTPAAQPSAAQTPFGQTPFAQPARPGFGSSVWGGPALATSQTTQQPASSLFAPPAATASQTPQQPTSNLFAPPPATALLERKRKATEDDEGAANPKSPKSPKLNQSVDGTEHSKLPGNASNTAKLFEATLERPTAASSNMFGGNAQNATSTSSSQSLFAPVENKASVGGGFTPSTSSLFAPKQASSKASPNGSTPAVTPATLGGFTPSVAPPAGGTHGFLSAFGQQAQAAAAKEKKRRRDEDFDSEEDDEEEWERRDAEEQARKRQKIEEAAKSTSGFTFKPINQSSAPSIAGMKIKKDASTKEVSTEDASTKVASDKQDAETTKHAEDHTWTPGSPIKFGGSASAAISATSAAVLKSGGSASAAPSATSAAVLKSGGSTSAAPSATPTAAPKFGLFGAPLAPATTSNGTTSLFAHLGKPQPSASFLFGQPKTAAPTSAVTGQEKAGDADAKDGEDEDAAPEEPQMEDMTALLQSERDESETLVHVAKAKARKLETRPSEGGTEKLTWVDKGIGPMWILRNKTTGKTRVLLKVPPYGKPAMNFALLRGPDSMYRHEGMKGKGVVATFVDHLDGNPSGKPSQWAIIVGLEADAKEIASVFREEQQKA